MSDFDWLQLGTDDWSHRSLHPDTRLNCYVDADLAVGRDMAGPADMSLNLHGSLRTATSSGRRGAAAWSVPATGSATLPDGLTVVSYRPRQVSLFAGVEVDRQFGDWTVSGRVRGGVGINPCETDHHWLRDLRFDRSYDATPFVDLAARVDYRLTDRTMAFVQARHVRHDDRRGDSRYSQIKTGQGDRQRRLERRNGPVGDAGVRRRQPREEAAEAPKARRGRPPKAAADTAAEGSVDAPRATKGRKPKAVTEEGTEAPAAAVGEDDAPKAKRGRKPKVAPEGSDTAE
ncbi:omptin family outer membrane protease [Paracoccus beibuensis]|uniref:omptin family outer membrane protease n=1 Tax=Paracoccus beibuensis TaxID=547602 RepID=UPI00223EEE55|nr:omptin family outer membrane protease [Paracoccus beibuensis]